MSYTKQGFKNDMTLDAEHLINIENAILELYDLISKSQVTVQTVDNALVLTQDLTIQNEEA